MKTFALRNGDLVIGPEGFKTISGTKKIRQDLSLAIGEEYGSDRFHPQWGSTLQRMVGTTITEDTPFTVRSEVARVIQQYIDIQRFENVQDKMAFRRSRYSTSEIINRVNSIDASVNLDTVSIRINLSTVGRDVITLARTVDLNA